jgi:hypothetical protein
MGATMAAALMLPTSLHAQQSGLVNLNIDDVTVQIPVAVAANICGVAVEVLANQIAQGPVDCETGTIALAEDDGGEAEPVDQEGLINVNLTNVDVQVPVAVAANVCGLTIDILAAALLAGPVTCDANGSAVVSP